MASSMSAHAQKTGRRVVRDFQILQIHNAYMRSRIAALESALAATKDDKDAKKGEVLPMFFTRSLPPPVSNKHAEQLQLELGTLPGSPYYRDDVVEWTNRAVFDTLAKTRALFLADMCRVCFDLKITDTTPNGYLKDAIILNRKTAKTMTHGVVLMRFTHQGHFVCLTPGNIGPRSSNSTETAMFPNFTISINTHEEMREIAWHTSTGVRPMLEIFNDLRSSAMILMKKTAMEEIADMLRGFGFVASAAYTTVDFEATETTPLHALFNTGMMVIESIDTTDKPGELVINLLWSFAWKGDSRFNVCGIRDSIKTHGDGIMHNSVMPSTRSKLLEYVTMMIKETVPQIMEDPKLGRDILRAYASRVWKCCSARGSDPSEITKYRLNVESHDRVPTFLRIRDTKAANDATINLDPSCSEPLPPLESIRFLISHHNEKSSYYNPLHLTPNILADVKDEITSALYREETGIDRIYTAVSRDYLMNMILLSPYVKDLGDTTSVDFLFGAVGRHDVGCDGIRVQRVSNYSNTYHVGTFKNDVFKRLFTTDYSEDPVIQITRFMSEEIVKPCSDRNMRAQARLQDLSE